MKKRILFLMIFFVMPCAFADIAINLEKGEFNLGDKLIVSLDITQKESVEGLLRVNIICNNNNTFEYYTTPISFNAGIKEHIGIPEMTLYDNLLGNCYINAVLKSSKDILIEEMPSALFTVSNALNIFLSQSSFTVNPGDEINIRGSVKKIYDANSDANVILIFDGKTIPVPLRKGLIDYTLNIAPNIKSNAHYIDIIAEDKSGNKGKEVIELNINPIPTKIEMALNNKVFMPSQQLAVNLKILDQANDILAGNINFEIINPEHGKIYMEAVNSNSQINYFFDFDALPGKYDIRASYDDLSAEDTIVVQEYEQIKVSLQNSVVIVENLGNINYNKRIDIFLKNEKNEEYTISKKLRLSPGESYNIDLSKEVPSGTYRIRLPEETIDQVTIQDTRTFLKKAGQSFVKITGKVVGLSDKSYMTPFAASMIVIIILLSIILVINRRKIKRIFGR